MSRTDVNISKVTTAGGTYRIDYFDAKGGSQGSISGVAQNPSGFSEFGEFRSGSITAGYGSRKRKNPLPVNNFTYSLISTKQFMGSAILYGLKSPSGYNIRYDFGAMEKHIGANLPPGALESQIDSYTTQLIAKATNDVLHNIKVDSSQLMLMFAERQKTVDLVANTAIKLAAAYSSLKRGDLSGFAGQLSGVIVSRRDVADYKRRHRRRPGAAASHAWLEHRYGWLPLLQDIDDTCRFLATGLQRPLYGTARGGAHRSEGRETKNVCGAPYMVNYHEVIRVDVKIGVTYSVNQSWLANLNRTGITNPLDLAWELLPFSFVVDWMLPVGSWLETLDATLGLSFLDGYQTVFREYDRLATGGLYTAPPNSSPAMSITTARGTKKLVKCDRSKLASFPSPCLPTFKDPTSVVHMVSALALLRAAFD